MGFKNSMFLLCAMVALALAMVACHPEEDSCNIRTGGVYVEYLVVDEGEDAYVKATFWTGDRAGGTFLQLGEDCADTIEVNDKTLKYQDQNPGFYSASIAKEDTYVFKFIREDEGDYLSTVSTPPAFAIEMPTAESSASRADDLELSWETELENGEMELIIDGDCIQRFNSDVTDDGTFTVNAGEIETHSGQEDKTCSVDMELTRQQSGTLDSELKGTIKGQTHRTRTISSTP